jgi:hypothetical protein
MQLPDQPKGLLVISGSLLCIAPLLRKLAELTKQVSFLL